MGYNTFFMLPLGVCHDIIHIHDEPIASTVKLSNIKSTINKGISGMHKTVTITCKA